MKKKLKTWQIVFLIIFYPAGIAYLIYKFYKKYQESNPTFDSSKATIEREFYTKVVGVTYTNDDGSSRQKIISGCKAGDGIIFRPAPVPEHPNAIGVFTESGKQLGHLKSELAHELRERYPMNLMKAEISNIAGGHDGLNYGCNLHIVIYRETSFATSPQNITPNCSNEVKCNVTHEYINLTTKKSIKEFRVNNTYIILDLETSGLSKYSNEIIEIAMLKIENGNKIDRFVSLVKPSHPIDKKIEEITGITNEMLSSAPTFASIANDVVSFIGDNVLIAHNAKFDIGFLSEALEPLKVNLKYIDTLALARKALPELENHKLATLIAHYDIAEAQTHRAMDDVECTQEIFVRLCDEILSHVNKRTTAEEVK